MDVAVTFVQSPSTFHKVHRPLLALSPINSVSDDARVARTHPAGQILASKLLPSTFHGQQLRAGILFRHSAPNECRVYFGSHCGNIINCKKIRPSSCELSGKISENRVSPPSDENLPTISPDEALNTSNQGGHKLSEEQEALRDGLEARFHSSRTFHRTSDATAGYGHSHFHENSSLLKESRPDLQRQNSSQRQVVQQEREECRPIETEQAKDHGRTLLHEKLGRRLVLCSLPIAAATLGATASGMRANAMSGDAVRLKNVYNIRTNTQIDKAAESALVSLRSRVSSFTLPNGMRWVVAERRASPIVSCHTYAAVGASDEIDGQTGLAHLLEHLAFKGSRRVGTRDADREEVLLELLDEVFYDRLEAAETGNWGASRRLAKQFEMLKQKASELAVPNEYGALLSRQGGVGLNAQTSQDSTEYFVSLPSNKLELWMSLESERFRAPVFRELYSEKEVVKEERRLRVDNAPLGRFSETFAEAAFPGRAYRRPVIGYPSDLERIGRREVESFFRERYTPRSLTCAVVGDVDAHEVERMALKYFGGWAAPVVTQFVGDVPAAQWRVSDGWETVPSLVADGREDDNDLSRRTIRMALPTSPFFMEGYYRPGASSTDDPAISVLTSVLSGSRTSRLYKNLVLSGQVLSASAAESFPGDKQPCCLLLYGIPNLGSSTDEVARLLEQQLEAIASDGVSEDELQPAHKSARAGLLEVFGSNSGVARLLCEYSSESGSWEGLLRESQFLEEVTPADVQRVAGQLCRSSNPRVAGHVRTAAISPPTFPFPLRTGGMQAGR
eukprot:TRINITY_DN23215_c0_g1_i1.p1 TRINITY_DN23215_c0_g1~~TRINITY_DN23215_c0_g1_i1.p1  ORF type:complete len:789 (-),score=93.95 TRINITY_DN23215_c0_g1_i1:254-2620(-)